MQPAIELHLLVWCRDFWSTRLIYLLLKAAATPGSVHLTVLHFLISTEKTIIELIDSLSGE